MVAEAQRSQAGRDHDGTRGKETRQSCEGPHNKLFVVLLDHDGGVGECAGKTKVIMQDGGG